MQSREYENLVGTTGLTIPNNLHCEINKLRRGWSKNYPSSVEEKYYKLHISMRVGLYCFSYIKLHIITNRHIFYLDHMQLQCDFHIL